MNSSKSERRAIKSAETSTGDRRAGSVGERPELARAGSKDSSEASTSPEPGVQHSSEDPAEA